VIEALRQVVEADERVTYALLFGSAREGVVRPGGDVDVAVALNEPASAVIVGALTARLEAAAQHPVDLVVIAEAPPAIAYRIFRDGVVLVCRDRAAFADRQARAVMEYLDFRPVEETLTRGALAAARGR
jgi:predicted nucleotidyltransferase